MSTRGARQCVTAKSWFLCSACRLDLAYSVRQELAPALGAGDSSKLLSNGIKPEGSGLGWANDRWSHPARHAAEGGTTEAQSARHRGAPMMHVISRW